MRVRDAGGSTPLCETKDQAPVLADGGFFVYAGAMDLREDVTDRLKQMVADIPDDLAQPRNPEKITLVQAAREIEQLRAQVKHLSAPKAFPEYATEPEYDWRAPYGFQTPENAADFLDEAMATDLRTYPLEREAIRTLQEYARQDKKALRNKLSRELARKGPTEEPLAKMRIYINSDLKKIATPNKLAAHAAHAALVAVGAHPDYKVIVLDARPNKIREMTTVIHDAGHTQLAPGTMTAGTNWPEDSAE